MLKLQQYYRQLSSEVGSGFVSAAEVESMREALPQTDDPFIIECALSRKAGMLAEIEQMLRVILVN